MGPADRMEAAIAPGECKEIHIGPEGEVGAVWVRPITEAMDDWGDDLPDYAASEASKRNRYLLMIHPWGPTLILWDDDGGEVITRDHLLW